MAKKAVKKTSVKSHSKNVFKTKAIQVKPKARPSATKKEDILTYIKLAISTEKKGIKFYTEVKSKINDYNMKRLMDTLIEQENVHLKYFTGIYEAEKKKGTSDAAKVAASYSPQPKLKNPLFGMRQLQEVVRTKSAIYHVFNQALQFETDGYDLYMKLAKKVKNRKISEFLKIVANEELRHRDFIKMHQDAVYNTEYWMGMDHVRLES
ncbi:MAG: ferritin family protein [Candidatus Woesearchaeota archaeon]